jgi:hypothetical protein
VSIQVRPLLGRIVGSAVDATGATRGGLLAVDGQQIRLVAVAGTGADELVGRTMGAGAGVAGYVMSSGQPLALTPRADGDQFGRGLQSLLASRPESLVCVPCDSDGAIVGALELVDKTGGSFGYDDVEITTLLAGIAGSALAEEVEVAVPPTPAEVVRDLEQLGDLAPDRYRAAASILRVLLADG